MKRWLFCFALLAAAACGERQSQPQQLVVITMNMRYDNPEDGENNWRFRRERIAAMLREQAPDVFGTQELLANQYDDLGALLPDYRSVGVGREDGDRAGEFNAVFFRADAFELLDSGTFWLSEEPERPGSKGWDGACERLATWVVLRRGGDGREFLFINTHLDHVGEQARREGVALLLRRIETLRGDRPVILTGDFNAEPDSPVIAHVVEGGLLKSTGEVAAEKFGPSWSFADFGQIPEAERPLIDYIFIGGDLRSDRYEVLPDLYEGGYLSDHAPVAARLTFTR